MRKLLAGVVLVAACGGPSGPADYVESYGGLESQYRVILESEDCGWLGETADEMDRRYDEQRDRVAFGYQSAATSRMVDLDC